MASDETALGWRQLTLGGIADPIRGVVDGPFGSNLPASDYEITGVPVIRGSNLSTGTKRFVDTEFAFVSPQTALRLSRSLCQANDIIFTKKGTLGQTGIIPSRGRFDKYVLSSNQMRLAVNNETAFPLFVYYYVSSQTAIERIVREAEATGVPKINLGYLKQFPILLPPLAEQRAIASTLGALDDKIELNRRMNETLESMARVLFKSWFVDFDPVRARMEGRQPFGMDAETTALFPCALTDSPLGRIPAGWEVGRLDDLATIVMGASPPGETYNETGQGTPLVNGPVEFGEYFTERLKWTTAPTRTSRESDLIMCVRGSTTGRRVIADGEYCLGRGVCAIRAKDGWQPFVNQLVSYNLERLLTKTTGSVFPNLGGPDINNFEVIRPPDTVIGSFCSRVSALIGRLEANIRMNRTLAAIRDTLLPKMMSGEVRV